MRIQTLIKTFLLALFLSACFHACEEGPLPSYLIKNGKVYDGLGNPPQNVDIVIRNGLIEMIQPGSVKSAQNEIDAAGLIVAPGFIDVHNHTDQSINDEERKMNEGFLRQGVTTVVGGPDGRWAPKAIKEMISTYDSIGIGTNVAFYVGHNGIRQEVMKDYQQRAPSAEELDRMKALVKEGMELGAVGLSTGLMYPPGMYSETEEVVTLAKEVRPYGGIYDSHVRNPVHEFVKSHTEVVEISTSAGIAGKLGHLKGVGLHNKGKIKDIIQLVEEARSDGYNIVSDQYPYDGAQTERLESIIVIPENIDNREAIINLWMRGDVEGATRLLRPLLQNSSTRSRIKVTSENGENGGFAWLKATGYTSMRVTNAPDQPELVGLYLSQIAEMREMDPFDTVCDLILNSESGIHITLGGINEEDVQELLVQPWNIIASDGAYGDGSDSAQGHPRSTGTFTRFLGHYVRDLGLLPMEEAIRKITSMPADMMGLKNRGRLQDGLPADIVVFDPSTIIDRSTFERPNRFSKGVIHVFVNGEAVLLNETLTLQAPGIFLKRQQGEIIE